MESSTFRRRWLVPIVTLFTLALLGFCCFYALDHYVTAAEPTSAPRNPFERYVRFNPPTISDSMSSMAGMIAAVLGIVITVVSIIVQLSADRFAGVTRMFLRDKVNLGVMGYYVVTCVMGVFFSWSLQPDYVPRATLLAMTVATTMGLVLMAPYFGYVFDFLDPMNIIARIRRHAQHVAGFGLGQDGAALTEAQSETLSSMEELTDITSNSISGKDKIIASGAVDALKDLAIEYLKMKPKATERWFEIGPGIRNNPDFVAMDPESLQDLERRRTWVEWKVMRQYLGIYNEALATMRDINYLIAIDTRYIGEAAAHADEDELVELVFRFMNSYLRTTLNARDVRTAYNVLNQYRLLVEAMLRLEKGAAALGGVRHMIYYGHVSYDMKLPFVTETVAYDVSALCQYARELGAAEESAMLERFLELDRPLRTKSQESALLGVRKAQVKLAAFYLANGEHAKARRIADDMAHEPLDRLHTIRESLQSVVSKDFWEITDRGRNFEYMPEAQRQCLAGFFEWFGSGAPGDPKPAA